MAALSLPRVWHRLLVIGLLVLAGITVWFAARQPPHWSMFRPIGLWDVGQLNWWAHPLERNAFRRLVVHGDLNAVFALPAGEQVWAVGDGGLIMHSADGGQTWQQQRPAAAPALRTAAVRSTLTGAGWLPISSAQAAVPSKGPVQNATPAADVITQSPVQSANPPVTNRVDPAAAKAAEAARAKQAVKARPPAPPTVQAAEAPSAASAAAVAPVKDAVPVDQADLRAIHFVNASLGWAVGEDGIVLATRDGGATWAVQASGGGATLNGVQFSADGLKGWAVGESGTVLATLDGGASWTPQASGLPVGLSAVHAAADGRKVWVVGRQGAILATGDGGSTWARLDSGTPADLLALHVAADGQRAWAVGGAGTVRHTRDGGRTWEAQASRASVALSGVHFADDGLHGYVVGEQGRALTTDDGGRVWTPLANDTGVSLRGVRQAADGRMAWVVGAEGAMWAVDRSRDLVLNETGGLRSRFVQVRFAKDGLNGWLISDAGNRLDTRDGGSTWVVDPTSWALEDWRFGTDGRTGWRIDARGQLLATRDGGKTSAAAYLPSTLRLRGLHVAADGTHVWAVGDDGALIATRDGGTTWSAPARLTGSTLHAVQFADDGRTGWVAGAEGTVFVTRDGGASWKAQESGTRSELYALHFPANTVTGWAVGSDGAVLATRDGGTTWTQPASYSRTWAPWAWATLAGLLGLLAGLLAFVQPVAAGAAAPAPSADDSGGATTLRSDQPVFDRARDRLGYATAVQALSSFIRNRDTQPRVTIAVTGEWGTGKSSIMRMLQSDLDQAGFRTAWFNAWHQQQEGRQLSALFNTVRQQAVPRWWGIEFLAALRVRSRLIWGRGAFYKVVAVAAGAGCALLLGDLLADGPVEAWTHVRANVNHHLLQRQQTAITGASLARLDPTRKPAPAVAAAGASAPGAADAGANAAMPAKGLPAGMDPCSDEKQAIEARQQHKKAEPVRLAVYCELKRNFVYDEGGDAAQCGVLKDNEPVVARRCIFDSAADLLATLENVDKNGVRTLWPSEAAAVRAAAETLPPPPPFRWLQGSLLGGLAGFLVVLFTKGVSVYGLQVMAPLRALLGGERAKDEGKEAAGTVERYRDEFGLLCDALHGRLVIFIDDLDRCTPATVNGALEMTNYLADVGKCFIVIGAAMERVARCIEPPVKSTPDSDYANEYLRKLIHVEMPVPLRRSELVGLLNEPAADTVARDAPSRVSKWWLRVRMPVLAVLAAGVLVVVAMAGRALHQGGDGAALQVAPRPSPSAATAASAVANNPIDAESAIAPSPARRQAGAGVGIESAPAATAWPWGWLALIAAVVAAGQALGWARRHADALRVTLGGALRSHDSQDFMTALQLWNPVIVQHDPTPRHVKRFFNRARLFAAYDKEAARAGGVEPTPDDALVWMAALHHVGPEFLRDVRNAMPADDAGQDNTVPRVDRAEAEAAQWFKAPDESNAAQVAQVQAMRAAWCAHRARFAGLPTLAQVDRFLARVEGIHVR